MGGGSICEVWRTETRDGRKVVVKQTPYPAEVEADGLEALAAAGAPVPEVLRAEGDLLVLELVSGSPDWEGLGRAVAQLHADVDDTFGWHADNRIGPLVQDNTEAASWTAFFAERRIRPHLYAPALPDAVRSRLAAALDGPLQDLLDTDPPASLVHGDLWSGNVVDGRWLIDPAVHRADREFELAFAEVFGGFHRDFHAAYAEAWPLPEGWQRRRPALQLYHLLVHVRLFGAGYVSAVTSRLDALGW